MRTTIFYTVAAVLAATAYAEPPYSPSDRAVRLVQRDPMALPDPVRLDADSEPERIRVELAEKAELLRAIARLTAILDDTTRPVRQTSGYCDPNGICYPTDRQQYEAHQIQIAPQYQQRLVEQPLPVTVQMPAPPMHPVEVPATSPRWQVTPQYHQSAPVIDGNRNFQHARPRIFYIDGKPVIGIDPEPTDFCSRLKRFIFDD